MRLLCQSSRGMVSRPETIPFLLVTFSLGVRPMLTQPGFSPILASLLALNAFKLNVLGGGAGDPTDLKLFKNNVTVSPTTVIADLIEADFSGYADISITEASWGGFVTRPDGSAMIMNNTIRTWMPNAATIGNTIYGWYLVSSLGALLMMGNLPAPAVMDTVLKYLSIELAMILPAGAPANLTDVETNG
jgi:hypothetical protein